MEKVKYYNLDKILKYNADYNIIYGERSNGKTYACIKYSIEDYYKNKKQSIYLRRFVEEIKSDYILQVYQALINNNEIEKITKNKYNNLICKKRCLYLVKIENDKIIEEDLTPCVFALAISEGTKIKSQSFNNVNTIIFDEFITNEIYLNNEFVKFQNLLSTVIRLRDNIKIFMLGNSINRFCPYFEEMRLKNIKNQESGTIELYTFSNNLKIACEFVDFDAKYKKSNKYFSFDNPLLNVITGTNENGSKWSIPTYPHIDFTFFPGQELYKFYIDFDNELIQGNIILKDNQYILFFHKKTTPIKEDNKQIVYTFKHSLKNNYYNNFLTTNNKITKIINKLYFDNKVVFDNNFTGDIVNNFIKECKKGG